jgi:HEAT repeat protein
MLAFVDSVIVAVGGLFVLVMGAILLHKLLAQLRGAYERRVRADYLPKIQAYVNADAGTFAEFLPGPFGTWARRVVQWTLLEQIRHVRGRVQERITAAFEELGFVDQERRKLGERRWARRVEGAEKLARMMSRAPLPDLVRLMKDPVPEVRIRAAKALGAIGGLEAIASLLAALHDTNRWSTLRIADILASVGPQAVEPLLKEFPELPGPARVPAVDILGRLRSHLAVPLLRRLLEDRDANARARAAHSLGVIGDPRAAPDLVEALHDEAWPVRAMAAKALGMIAGADGIAALQAALADKEWWVRSNAAEALRAKGEPGYRALISLLDGPDAYAAQKAAWMLQEAGVFDGYVKQLVDGEGHEREEARALLGKLVALSRTDLLTDIAGRHKDPRIRTAMQELLTGPAVGAA